MITITKKAKPPKRKPGQRAGLTRAIIVAKALGLFEKDPKLNMLTIAKAHNVARGAISAHFPGGFPEILTEMVRTALKDVARPFYPGESWEAYLRNLFQSVLHAFHGHRNLAPVLGSQLSKNYYLNPLLVERILLALNLAGFPEEGRAKALDLVMASLVGFIAIECVGLGSKSVASWTEDQASMIDGLPASEHPQIQTLKTQLIKAAKERSAQATLKKPASARARRFSDPLIASLKAQI